MLVPVLARPASPVVLVLDETAVALYPVLAAVFAAGTVMVAVVFAAETVVVAAVVSGPAVWVHHVWIGVVSSNPHQHLSHLSFCG